MKYNVYSGAVQALFLIVVSVALYFCIYFLPESSSAPAPLERKCKYCVPEFVGYWEGDHCGKPTYVTLTKDGKYHEYYGESNYVGHWTLKDGMISVEAIQTRHNGSWTKHTWRFRFKEGHLYYHMHTIYSRVLGPEG